MDLVWSGLKTGFLSVETASTLLYAQPQPLICEAILVFLIAWLFYMKIEYFQTIRKRDFSHSRKIKKKLNYFVFN